jgi:myo-inositol-1(or 4)-monophosphatase
LPAPEPIAQNDDHVLLCEAVRTAGAHARQLFELGIDHWSKQDGTPVCRADIEVDAILRERLVGARGGYGWLSEETRDSAERLRQRQVWVVDPVDGTRAFLRGDPHWTISAALVEDGRPVLAAIYNPVTGEFFDAVEGAGARLNGEAISVSERDTLKGCRMLMHRSVKESPKWREPWPEMATEMRNSMAYRLSLVACGSFDATLAVSAKSEWDLAAADLIVSEAGGIVSAHDGARFTYNEPDYRRPNVLAAGPGLYDAILARARARRA